MGIFEAILSSKKPEAKDLRRWILGEVIPAVVKYGGYIREDANHRHPVVDEILEFYKNVA